MDARNTDHTFGIQPHFCDYNAQSLELLLNNGFKNDWKPFSHFFTLKAMETLANWNSGARTQISPEYHNIKPQIH